MIAAPKTSSSSGARESSVLFGAWLNILLYLLNAYNMCLWILAWCYYRKRFSEKSEDVLYNTYITSTNQAIYCIYTSSKNNNYNINNNNICK